MSANILVLRKKILLVKSWSMWLMVITSSSELLAPNCLHYSIDICHLGFVTYLFLLFCIVMYHRVRFSRFSNKIWHHHCLGVDCASLGSRRKTHTDLFCYCSAYFLWICCLNPCDLKLPLNIWDLHPLSPNCCQNYLLKMQILSCSFYA